MIKKITFICLFALTASNTQVKPVNLQQTAFCTGAIALVTKIIAEAVAIEQLNKTTAKAVGIQASADATSNAATIAGLTVPLQLFADCFKKSNYKDVFENPSKVKEFKFDRTFINNTPPQKNIPGYEVVDDDSNETNNYLVQYYGETFNKNFTDQYILSAMIAAALGTLKLEEVIKHLAQNKSMYQNRNAIAQYRKEPQVQEFLTKQKSKQRRWIAANWLLPILAIVGAAALKDAEIFSNDKGDNAVKVTLVASLLAGYISEQFRAAKFNKLANATKDNPLDIPDQEEDADQTQTEQTTPLTKAS